MSLFYHSAVQFSQQFAAFACYFIFSIGKLIALSPLEAFELF
jgi:hypothetical protein